MTYRFLQRFLRFVALESVVVAAVDRFRPTDMAPLFPRQSA